MKLSKREMIMVIGLLFIVVLAGFWFLFLSPANDQLAQQQVEYRNLKAMDDANQVIINNVSALDTSLTALKSNVGEIENSLLPELDTEVISEHIANIFEDNGLHYITEISSEPIVTEQLTLTNGTTSKDNIQWIRIKMKVSGTDGITEGGVPAVGYNAFISAVKEIEAVKPNAIHVSSVSMEDTEQGFQYFLVSVDVFAFNLYNRVAGIDTSDPFITWDRDAVAAGGFMGTPYDAIPQSKLATFLFRPFATLQIPSAAATNAATSDTSTTVPTPTP